ncbi:hypothetical protein, partial [Sporichthya brevicatena]|uniref:hypothetical protein n=1 Tax=Sporichthya brevicatena TaxID=171442 RepID=UPI0031D4DC78
MAAEVGLAYVRIVPSMKGFSAAASKEMSAGMTSAADVAAKKTEGRLAKFNKVAKVASAAVLGTMAVVGKQSVSLASTQAANFSKFEQVTKTAMDSQHKT